MDKIFTPKQFGIFFIIFQSYLLQAQLPLSLRFCPGTTNSYIEYSTGLRLLNSYDKDLLYFTNPVSYKLDSLRNIYLETISSPQAEDLFLHYSGYAEFEGNCGVDTIMVTVSDELKYNLYDGLPDTITRTFTATCNGTPFEEPCIQEIYMIECPITLRFCPGTVDGRTTNIGYELWTCSDIDFLLYTSPMTYRLDYLRNLIPGSFSSQQAEELSLHNTGYAEFTNPCQLDTILVTVTDELIRIPYDGIPDTIRRTFIAQTGLFNGDSPCIQDIIIQDCEPAPIPTLGTWAQIILVLTLMIAASLFWSGRHVHQEKVRIKS